MIGLSDVSGALGAVSNALGGGAPGAPAAPGDPVFLRGEHIDQENEETGGATAPNLVNDRDSHPQIEFIHFGNVHTSYGNLFPHDSYKDNEPVESLPEKARPRGAQFRSALEREAVLLGVFIECAQTVLAEREGMGSLGALANTAGSLLGGGAGGNGKAADLDAPLQKVIAAAGTLNVASIQYHDTHKAGRDFHQARTDHRALLKKVVGEPAKPAPGAGLLGAIPGAGSAAGPVAGLVTVTQGIVFKATDIKIKCYALLAAQQERQIEQACHDLSLLAIKERANPFLPVWCPTPEKQTLLGQAASAAKQAADKANLASAFNTAIGDPLGLSGPGNADPNKDTLGEEKGFFDVDDPPETPKGTPFMAQAFDKPEPSKVPGDPVPMEMGKLVCQGFIQAIGQPSLPALVEKIIGEVNGVTAEFMLAVYETLLKRPAGQAITQQKLVKGAVEKINLIDRFKKITTDKLDILQKAKNFNASAMGYSFSPGALADQANTKIEDLVNDRIAPIMDKAIGTAMGELASQLELARQDAATTKSYVMEWYLGRMPWARTGVFFNLFFPFWNALMRCVTEVVGGPAGAALKGVVDASDKLKGAADTAKGYADKAQNVKDNLLSGQNLLDPGKLSTLDKGKADAGVATQGLSAAAPIPRNRFKPIFSSRIADGQGMEITDYDTVKNDHQWDSATDPDAPPPEEPAKPSA